MLQQPVSKELRSFKSLSKFAGPPQRRIQNQRRQSGLSRHHSQSRRRRNDSSQNDDTSEGMESIEPGSSTMDPSRGTKAPLLSAVSRTMSAATPHQRYAAARGKRVSLPSTGPFIDYDMRRPSLDIDEALEEEEDRGGGQSIDRQTPIKPRRPTQVEWHDDADFIEDEDLSDEDNDLPYPGFVEPALHCLHQAQPPRSWALRMVTNPWFDRLTMFVIVLNCITLGMYRPCEDGADCHTYRCYVLSLVDHLIFAYFAAEMMIKTIALGFYGENAYLSDTWNRLDFFIVMAGIAEYLLQEYLGNINLTAIRTIRVLRPLRAVNRIPSMRILDITYHKRHHSIIYVANLTHPAYIPAKTYRLIRETGPNAISLWINMLWFQMRAASIGILYGSVSFDNIGFAWVAIFLVISLEGWTDIVRFNTVMLHIGKISLDVLRTGYISSYSLWINLCLVVIATQFAETKRRETERMLQERKRMRSRGSLTSSDQGIATSSKDGGGDSVYAAIVRIIGQLSRRAKRYIIRRYREYRNKPKKGQCQFTLKEDENHAEANCDDNCTAVSFERNNSSTSLENPRPEKKLNGSLNSKDSFYHVSTNFVIVDFRHRSSAYDMEKPKRKHKVKTISTWNKFRNKVKRFVICDHFTRGILVAILVNTLSMGVEYHQQPEILTTILEYSNLFFTALFAFEMTLKVIADGLFGYLSDGFNLFDGGIVALSVLELFQEGKGGLSVLRTFRLLRILKLVRFMPALRYQLVVMLRTMDNVTVFFGLLILFIFIFSCLGMFLFGCKFCKVQCSREEVTREKALAWNQLYYKGNCECERTNFDSMTDSFLTVFQILTQEDWNMVLFNGMSQTTPWAALYFVALMTFGNYVLFNLLVAILVEGFQESKEEEKRQLEDEARKKADEEEQERKRELQMLIAKTTSPAFMENQDSHGVCTCGAANLSSIRQQLEGRSRTCSTVGLEPWSQINSARSSDGNNHSTRRSSHKPNSSLPTNSLNCLVTDSQPSTARALCLHKSLPPLTPIVSKDGSSTNESDIVAEPFDTVQHRQQRAYNNRLNRHASLVLPENEKTHLLDGRPRSMISGGPDARQRINSWCGLHGMHASLFNPHCQLHGRRALIEAYARDKFIKASQELQQALAEERRKEEQRKNTKWRRFLRKTFIHSRSKCSLFIFSPTNSFRVLIFIGINCVTLAMERPSIPPESPERMFLIVSGYIFTAIFTMEMSIKVIANGCFVGEEAYFKDGWNILDGVLVIISLINVIMEFFVSGDSPKIFGVIRVLRLLRALRPLRVINRAPGVKLVVMTLISSLKPIGNIVLICCTFFIIFGILGVQLFKGTMFHCVGVEISNVTTKAECLADPRNKWTNHRYNFDNLGQALMSLFVLSSKDGWVAIMYQGIDAVGVDLQPSENYNEWRMIYFISFLLLVGFFVLNMFVGVVVENFHKCKEALEAEMKEKARQKRLQRKIKEQQYEEKYGEMRKKDKRKKVSLPYWHGYGPNRLAVHSIVTSKYFDLAIAAVIGINAMEFYMMPDGLKYVLRALNYFFTAVFTLEAGMKLYALGFKKFFEERNLVLKLLKMAKGIRSLLDTVGEALPQVGNLGSLFFLLFFIFAALGVELFGKLECSEDHPCDGLGEHAHFKNFGMAFLTLFRIATGDNWNGIMKDALRDDCDPGDACQTNCCVDPILAPCYFVIFVLISQFVLVNVVVAVLMKHLEESNKRNEIVEADPNAKDLIYTEVCPQTDRDDMSEEEEKEVLALANIERDLLEVEDQFVDEVSIGRRSISGINDDGIQIYDVSPELSICTSIPVQGRRRRSSPVRLGCYRSASGRRRNGETGNPLPRHQLSLRCSTWLKDTQGRKRNEDDAGDAFVSETIPLRSIIDDKSMISTVEPGYKKSANSVDRPTCADASIGRPLPCQVLVWTSRGDAYPGRSSCASNLGHVALSQASSLEKCQKKTQRLHSCHRGATPDTQDAPEDGEPSVQTQAEYALL
ncbi:ion transport protein [Ditylenchus destructor]|nr:ion transport protein [Ditylenchus destructor]